MKKRLSFLLVSVAFMTNFANAQDKVIPDTCIANGWGWGCSFYYDTITPGPTAGLGCTSVKVTKVKTTGWGSFAFTKLPVIDFSKYDRIEMLVYPEQAAQFKPNLTYKGWKPSGNVETSEVSNKVDAGALTLNEWQKVTIKLDGPIYSKDSSKTYTSLSDTTLGVNTIQLFMGCDHTMMCISKITLKAKVANSIDDKQLSKIAISPNPAKSKVTISTDEFENATITIRTIAGIEVLTTQAISNKTTIDVSSLSAGIYIVSIVTPQGIQSEKLSLE